MKNKLLAIILIGALGLASSAASCGGTVKDNAGKILAAADTAVTVATNAELAMRCGQPTALQPPACISPELHATLKADLLKAGDILVKARGLYAALPATGTPSITEITNLVAQAGAILQEVLAGFPDAQAKATVATHPAVVKTLAVK